jgi:hypothetical protein
MGSWDEQEAWDAERGAAERERMAAEWREAADSWRRKVASWTPDQAAAYAKIYTRPAHVYGGWLPGAPHRVTENAARSWTRPWLPRWARWGFDRSPDDTFTRRAARFAAREGIHFGTRWATLAVIAAIRTARRWAAEPSAARDTRRRADVVRRIGRMDGSTLAAAVAAARITRRGRARRTAVERVKYGAAAPAAHAHPRRALRRAGAAWGLARRVAGGQVQPASVPDAWVVARAVADGVITATLASERDGRSVPDGDHRR